MNQLMQCGKAPTMSSREIADLTNASHDNVLKTIRALVARGVVSGNETPYVHPQNGQTYSEFLLSYRDTMVVVSGYSVELRARIIDRWQELEAQQSMPRELSRIELLQIALDSEQKRIEAEAQRDHAIATKAQIGSKREASAMAKASSAVREVNRLKAELGRNQQHATIIAVERATGERMAKNAFVELRRWCRDNGAVAVDVADARYGTVKAWPADAWMHAYGIDLCALFQSCEVAA